MSITILALRLTPHMDQLLIKAYWLANLNTKKNEKGKHASMLTLVIRLLHVAIVMRFFGSKNVLHVHPKRIHLSHFVALMVEFPFQLCNQLLQFLIFFLITAMALPQKNFGTIYELITLCLLSLQWAQRLILLLMINQLHMCSR
uniref:Uncharacterized protein n=1 Tax=Populus trichocarpa TaxID=3694 RepID=A0A2K2BYU1_POPTR